MLKFLNTEKNRNLGLLLIRLIVGFTMVYHGAQKWGIIGDKSISGFAGNLDAMGFPLPTLNAYLAGIAELVGGALIMLGALFRPACLVVAFTMFVAAFVVHGKNGFGGQGGFEYPLNLAIVSLGLALIGSGRHALKTKFDC